MRSTSTSSKKARMNGAVTSSMEVPAAMARAMILSSMSVMFITWVTRKPRSLRVRRSRSSQT
jgi:flagellar biosynthesis protein FlhB